MRIKVMPDNSSSGLWNLDEDGIMIDYKELSISEGLKLRIVKWIQLYEEICPDGDWVNDLTKLEVLNSETMMIGVQLKKLFPEWHIECWLEQQVDKGTSRCSIDVVTISSVQKR
jgi:hypothetical protein